MKWQWYLTIAAVRQYMDLVGLRGELEDHNPDFMLAQNVLGDLSLTSREVPGIQARSGAKCYRGKITLHSKRQRIELTVTDSSRPGAGPTALEGGGRRQRCQQVQVLSWSVFYAIGSPEPNA